MTKAAGTAGAIDTAAAAGTAAAPTKRERGWIDLAGQGLQAHGFLELVLPRPRLQPGLNAWKMALWEGKSVSYTHLTLPTICSV